MIFAIDIYRAIVDSVDLYTQNVPRARPVTGFFLCADRLTVVVNKFDPVGLIGIERLDRTAFRTEGGIIAFAGPHADEIVAVGVCECG